LLKSLGCEVNIKENTLDDTRISYLTHSGSIIKHLQKSLEAHLEYETYIKPPILYHYTTAEGMKDTTAEGMKGIIESKTN